MRNYTLSLSPDYVSSWGFWEAIRELLQNAMDQGTWSMDHVDDDTLLIKSGGHLEPRTLLLGVSEKEPGSRGQFGEGYKLALLVLTRLGYCVEIFNGSELWIPSFVNSADYGTKVLQIGVIEDGAESVGIIYKIRNVDCAQYESIKSYIKESVDSILPDTLAGQVYVGGLYVCTLKEFKHGYTFESMKLDRDRGLVSSFDLSYRSSKMWMSSGRISEIRKLLEAKAPDVQYCDSWINASVATSLYNSYVEFYGKDVVPVTTQEEIKEVIDAGGKFQLVSLVLKKILNSCYKWVVPTNLGPAARLKRIIDKNYLSDDVRSELEDIIKLLESK